MATAVLDPKTTALKGTSAELVSRPYTPIKVFSPEIDAAIDRIVAAAPPLSQAQRDRLAAILGGGS
ncbi:hypothetical protein LOC59_03575 [Arthrobacter sp. zg-Y916]|uniref:hypothetical protein n=1 Tax=Arthrobacter sp. zg-Y916 TaxID=2894190 RepID=UPI001E383B86|nr:hypothetical protein [Arthrobacter sp. zg-Y916]MCC9192735.1 hypothetical protein [Arthrobacter sp. zg-Y916]